jgi:hypothetical protein
LLALLGLLGLERSAPPKQLPMAAGSLFLGLGGGLVLSAAASRLVE